MAKRGVLFITWGTGADAVLARALTSVATWHPELPIEIKRLPDGSDLLDKARMLQYSPFEETVFLDADTVVLGRLDFGFEKAARHGLACCVCECPWARRYGGLDGDMVEYNTGVLFFTAKAKPVFDAWEACARQIDSSILFMAGKDVRRMPFNDQAGFAKAIEDTGFVPFVLPQNWNFRPRWQNIFFGDIRIWHDYEPPPPALLAINEKQKATKVLECTRGNW